MLTASDTWRANRERHDRSRFREHPVNQDNVRFLQALRASYGRDAAPILIGGSFGPRGDALPAGRGADAARRGRVPRAADRGAGRGRARLPDREHAAGRVRGARNGRRLRRNRRAVPAELRRPPGRHGARRHAAGRRDRADRRHGAGAAGRLRGQLRPPDGAGAGARRRRARRRCASSTSRPTRRRCRPRSWSGARSWSAIGRPSSPRRFATSATTSASAPSGAAAAPAPSTSTRSRAACELAPAGDGGGGT